MQSGIGGNPGCRNPFSPFASFIESRALASLSSKTSTSLHLPDQTDSFSSSQPDIGGETMQFLSRFSSSKSKDPSSSSSKAHRRHSTPPPSAQSTSYLPLDLPSSSLLRDDSLSVPFGISPKPSRTQLASQDEEGIIASGSSRSVDTQPWVEIQGGQGGEGSPRIGQQSLEEMKRGKKEDLIRARKECVKLEKARIGQEQMITLMDECGETIRSRGEAPSYFRYPS